jgi:hypothetical protein
MRSRGSRSRPSGSFQAMRWMSCNTRAAGVIASSPNAKSAINVIVGEARPAASAGGYGCAGIASQLRGDSMVTVVVSPGSPLSPAQQMDSSESLPLLVVASNSQPADQVHAAAVAAQR